MKIEIRCIGKLNSKEIHNLCAEFTKRIGYKIEFVEKAVSKKLNVAEIKKDDADKLLQKIPNNSVLIALDENGREFTSPDFSKFFSKIETSANNIIFFIGGAHGLDANLLAKCQYKVSLSKMTFPHKFVRLFLVEQIYRAISIKNGHPYHKE